MESQVQLTARDGTKEAVWGPESERHAQVRRLVVSHEDRGFVERVCQHFEQLGWSVTTAFAPEEVRRLIDESPASVVLLPTQFDEESGWLLCAKLLQERPRCRVILIGPTSTPDLQRYTSFVGGHALLSMNSSIRSLVDEVFSAAELPLVN